MTLRPIIKDEVFGKWTIIAFVGIGDGGYRLVQARCECGTLKTHTFTALCSGKTKQCYRCRNLVIAKSHTKHGAYINYQEVPEYGAYRRMLARCSSTKRHNSHRYVGRGIKVDRLWLGPGGYDRFLAHVGQRPSAEHSLDRFPNPDGNYEPGNVRWATRKEQASNRGSGLLPLGRPRVSLRVF